MDPAFQITFRKNRLIKLPQTWAIPLPVPTEPEDSGLARGRNLSRGDTLVQRCRLEAYRACAHAQPEQSPSAAHSQRQKCFSWLKTAFLGKQQWQENPLALALGSPPRKHGCCRTKCCVRAAVLALTALLSIVRLLSNTGMREVCRIKGTEGQCFVY